MRWRMTYPKVIKKITAILETVLTYYAVGYYVLTGAADFPDAEELNEILTRLKSSCTQDLGIAIHAGNHSTVESYVLAMASAEEMIELIKQHGGTDKIAEAFKEYIKAFPKNARLLKQIGTGGKPGAPSLEQIAEEHYMNLRTLCSIRHKAMRGIALYMIYSENLFEDDIE